MRDVLRGRDEAITRWDSSTSHAMERCPACLYGACTRQTGRGAVPPRSDLARASTGSCIVCRDIWAPDNSRAPLYRLKLLAKPAVAGPPPLRVGSREHLCSTQEGERTPRLSGGSSAKEGQGSGALNRRKRSPCFGELASGQKRLHPGIGPTWIAH